MEDTPARTCLGEETVGERLVGRKHLERMGLGSWTRPLEQWFSTLTAQENCLEALRKFQCLGLYPRPIIEVFGGGT